MQSVFYATFIERALIPTSVVRNIFEILKLSEIYVFKVLDEDKYIVTFNIDKARLPKMSQFKNLFPNTIRINRKRKTNTLYTVNALNKLTQEHGGKECKNSRIDWNLYRDTCLLTNRANEMQMLKIELYDVIEY